MITCFKNSHCFLQLHVDMYIGSIFCVYVMMYILRAIITTITFTTITTTTIVISATIIIPTIATTTTRQPSPVRLTRNTVFFLSFQTFHLSELFHNFLRFSLQLHISFLIIFTMHTSSSLLFFLTSFLIYLSVYRFFFPLFQCTYMHIYIE